MEREANLTIPLPTFADVLAAADRISAYIHQTPVLTCAALDQLAQAKLYCKCENLQKVGAFKFRGACNAVFALTEAEAVRGVVTHSSGNHAQALALAAHVRGIPAYIIMPTDAPVVKRQAVLGYGGQVFDCQPTLAARETRTREIQAETGAILIHPYNDPRIIAGQGTATLELLAAVPNLDVILCPVGGGGLLSGTLLAAKGINPKVQVIAVEPELAQDAFTSIQTGTIQPPYPPVTVADGLRTALGTYTFAIIKKWIDDFILVNDAEIIAAMRLIMERMKLVVEPSGAVALAGALRQADRWQNRKVGLILCGGNVDLDRLPW